MVPSRASGEPLGMRVLEKRFFTLVLRLFSLTRTGMGQESMERYSPVMTARSMRLWMSWSRIFCSSLLCVFLRKEENLSTLGRGRRMLKPQRIAAEGLSFNSVTNSVKVGIPFRFLKMKVRKRLWRGKGFRPVEGWESR